MRSFMVRYKVEKGKVDMVRKAMSEFIEMVRRNESGTLAYDVFQEGERDFVHFMTFRNAQAESIHNSAGYTNRFMDLIYTACDEGPAYTDLSLVASNRAGTAGR